MTRNRRSILDEAEPEVALLRAEMAQVARQRTEDVLGEFTASRDTAMLAAWFVPRAWRELEYVYLLGEEIRRYGLSFERRHIVALAKHLEDEAEHYEALGRIIDGLGGVVPTSVPPSVQPWSDLLWESLEKHRLGGVAAWYISECAAIGSLEPTIAGARRLELPDVERAYVKIARDEEFHVGLGWRLLSYYTDTAADRDALLGIMHAMADVLREGAYVVDAGPVR